MTSEGKASARRGQRLVIAALCVAGALLLGACAGKRVQPDQTQQRGQQQALERARNLCRDFGYTPGTTEFARCAQSEYDRESQAVPPQAALPPRVVVAPPVVPAAPSLQAAQSQPTRPQPAQSQPAPSQPAQSQPAPQADTGDDDGLMRWMKRPNVCQQAACSAF
jgi:hypothetical protein